MALREGTEFYLDATEVNWGRGGRSGMRQDSIYQSRRKDHVLPKEKLFESVTYIE